MSTPLFKCVAHVDATLQVCRPKFVAFVDATVQVCRGRLRSADRGYTVPISRATGSYNSSVGIVARLCGHTASDIAVTLPAI